jgi:hypothetical protein
MKKTLIFLICISISALSYGQTNCADAHSDVNYAYSDVKAAYDSNNIDHLKLYSERSYDAFERAKIKLKSCKCQESYNYAYDASELLDQVKSVATFEDGRYFVKKARDIAKDVINELELCTELTKDDSELMHLQNEQLKLKQLQIDLKLKEKEIKQKLAEHKAEELNIKKQQFIQENENAINANIKNYNNILLLLGCDADAIKLTNDISDYKSKTMNELKLHYLDVVKKMTSSYLTTLNKCSSN